MVVVVGAGNEMNALRLMRGLEQANAVLRRDDRISRAGDDEQRGAHPSNSLFRLVPVLQHQSDGQEWIVSLAYPHHRREGRAKHERGRRRLHRERDSYGGAERLAEIDDFVRMNIITR